MQHHVEKEIYECAEMDFRNKAHIVSAVVTRTAGTQKMSSSSSSSSSSASSSHRMLSLEVESRETGARWTAQFTPKQLEELTAKTGNYKTFDTFVHMLAAALRGNAVSVFVDLLTYADLEALRRLRRGANANGASGAGIESVSGAGVGAPVSSAAAAAPTSTTNSKRYLILTYTGEFDRVHYPLPLSFEAEADAASLRRTCERLRAEIKALRSSQQTNTSAGGGAAPGHGDRNSEAHAQVITQLREDMDAMTAAKADLQERLDRAIEDGRVLHNELRRAHEEREDTAARLEEAEAEIAMLQRNTGRRAPPARLLEELSQRKQSERELRIRVRQLAGELSKSRSVPSSRRPSPAPGTRASSSSRRQSPAPGSRASSPASTVRGKSGPKPGTASPARSSTPERGRRRFDPTAYVRERERKLEYARRSRSAWSSPNGSRASSPSPSPARRRTRSPSPMSAPMSARAAAHRESSTATNKTRRREGLRAARPSLQQQQQQQQRLRANESQRRPMHVFKQQHKPPIPTVSTTTDKDSPAADDNGVTPVIKQPGDHVAPRPMPPLPQNTYANTNAEIADIDARLQALQDFLRSAKREGL